MSKNAISASATALPDRRLFLATGAAAAAVLCASHKAEASNADAELIAACASVLKTDAEFEVACGLDEYHPDLGRLNEEWRAGTASVSLIPAKTMAGIKAKTSVLVLWEPHSADEKDDLTDSIVADILAL